MIGKQLIWELMKQRGPNNPSLKFFVAIFAVLSLAGCRSDNSKFKALQNENAKLESENAELHSRISALQMANNDLRIASLGLAQSNGSLESKYGELALHAANLESETISLRSKNGDLTGKVQEIQNFPHYDGVWQCDKGPDVDNIISYRVLTSDSWALLTFNKTTNAFISGKAGTYVVNNRTYEETVSAPAPTDKTKDSFTQFIIDADGYGMGNEIEHWKRAHFE